MTTNEKGNGKLKGMWLAVLAVLMVCAGVLAFTASHANASAPLAAVKA